MGADEEGTLVALKAHRRELVDPKIAEHGGRIVKTTGDGLLLEFPSVVGAVRCVVEIQLAMAARNADIPDDRRIVFRIGVNLGDIISDGDDIFGDGVNIAARLQEVAAPGGICLADRVHDDVRGRFGTAFTDGGERPLKNIARPVRVWHWSQAEAGGAPPGIAQPAAPALPDKPSIAVLPFQNMSGDPEQEYFADGMVEEIITALSRARWLFVIARNSSFTYKGQAIDVKRVGRELGVRYVLEGSVRKGGNRVRITGQLVDAVTGAHLWADRFDGTLEDVFELQDSVAISVAGAIEPALEKAEISRAKARPTADLTAYDLFLRALPLVQAWDKEPSIRALDLLGQAIARDPRFGPALASAAWCHAMLYGGGWTDDAESRRRIGVELARRAVEAAPDDATVLANAAGALHGFGETLAPLLTMIAHAVALNPGNAYCWLWSGFLHIFAGDAATGIAHLETSLRLDPRTPFRPFHQTGIATGYFMMRRFDEAVPLLVGSLQQVPSYITTAWVLASCYAHMGRLDDARKVIDHLRTITPKLMPPAQWFHHPEQRAFFQSGAYLAMGQSANG